MIGKKTGGRAAGTPNRITRELRESLKAVLSSELDRLPETLSSLPPKDRLEIVVRLMPFAMPKVDSIAGSYDGDPWDR